MGFRSTFVTEDVHAELADWFVEKWKDRVHFQEGNRFPISSKYEAKSYNTWVDLESDVQKAYDWEDDDRPIVLMWLHECGGITRVEIRHDSIVYAEPNGWDRTDGIGHHYCYGCSDITSDPF